MNTISVVIPSRVPEYLNKTIEDLLKNAEEDIEIIVILDGYQTEILNDKRVKVIRFGQHKGMREAISQGMRIATGEYVMKIDEHCMVEKGFDVKLKADCEDGWVVIPRRKRLDTEKWEVIEDGRSPVDYMYLTNPFLRPDDKSNGLRGAEWKEKFHERKDFLIDEIMAWQGSCYFLKRDYWNRLFPNGLDTENYGTFTGEAQEIGNTVWLSGGKLIVNKKTHYAHFWKGRTGKGYRFSKEQYRKHMDDTERGRVYAVKHWLTTKDYKYDFKWLMKKFWPVPTWPDDWEDLIQREMKKGYNKIDKDWYENNK